MEVLAVKHYLLSETRIRVLTLDTSVVYCDAIQRGYSVQEAEQMRMVALRAHLGDDESTVRYG